VVIELDKGFEHHVKPLAVIQQRAVMIGNPPRPGVEVEAVVEGAGLLEAAELDESIATAQRPVASTGATVELQHLNLVAGLAQLQRRRHAGETRAENEH